MQIPENTGQETAPVKPKGKTASRAGDSDFSRFMGQFLGVVSPNIPRTGQEIGAGAPAPLPGNASLLVGVDGPDAPAAEGVETTDLALSSPGPEDDADLPKTGGTDDALIPVELDEAANKAAGSGHKHSPETGDSVKQEKSDLPALPAEQGPSGIVADEGKTGEPAGSGQGVAPATDDAFPAVMSHGSSGDLNAQAQTGGASMTRRTPGEEGSSPARAANAAEVLDPAPSIVKDGNRLAVRFEQEGLGKLDIDLRLNKGIISARIQVADEAAKTLMENNMRQIVDSLLKAGLSVGGFSVSLKDGGRRNGSPEEQHGYHTERAAVTAGSGGIAKRAGTDSLVSIFI